MTTTPATSLSTSTATITPPTIKKDSSIASAVNTALTPTKSATQPSTIVSLSNAGKAAAAEASEPQTKTAAEARKGDLPAKRLQEKRAASAAH